MSNQFTDQPFECVGYEGSGALGDMFKKMYWSQIFSWKTSWEVKKIAIKSLWIMKFNKLGV